MPNSFINYKIVPVGADFLRRARFAGLDDQNQPVERSLATGGEPLRDALRRALPGEAILLASYCPFDLPGPYREHGPVFVLADAGDADVDLTRLPLGETGAYIAGTFVLRAYCGAERIVDAALTTPEDAHRVLDGFLARADVAFVLARFAAYGCYACRIERV